MPLHLLGKKSWNVYNSQNIARVRRDEALAQAREEAEERRMQQGEADRRMALLRGEHPPPPPADDDFPRREDGAAFRGERRKRKRHGEDDTDFEMRVARERWDERYEERGHDNDDGTAAPSKRAKTSSAPLVGRDGHIDLFGHSGGPPDAPREDRERRRRADEPVHNMKFSEARGKDDKAKIGPWYVDRAGAGVDGFETTNVWGNNDPNRKERAVKQIGNDDPLLMMKSGASRVRELNKAKRRAEEERARELEGLIRDGRRAGERRGGEEQREERRERMRRREDEEKQRGGEGDRNTDRHGRRHGSRSRSRSRPRSRSRSRSRDRNGVGYRHRQIRRHSRDHDEEKMADGKPYEASGGARERRRQRSRSRSPARRSWSRSLRRGHDRTGRYRDRD